MKSEKGSSQNAFSSLEILHCSTASLFISSNPDFLALISFTLSPGFNVRNVKVNCPFSSET